MWTTYFSPWNANWRYFSAGPVPLPANWHERCIPIWNPPHTASSSGWPTPATQRATALAGFFGVGKATMSRQLHALEKLGLVAREPDPADGRAVLVRITDEGRERFTRVRTGRRAQYARRLASWDRAEVAELARLLHRLNAEQEGDEA